MGAVRYNYDKRDEFIDKLVNTAGISIRSARHYSLILVKSPGTTPYRTALGHWLNLMEGPAPTMEDVEFKHIHSKEIVSSLDVKSKQQLTNKEKSLKKDKRALKKNKMMLETKIKTLEEELILKRTSIKKSVQAEKILIKQLQESSVSISKLKRQLSERDAMIERLMQKCKDKDNKILVLRNSVNAEQLECLKAVIADQAVLIYTLTNEEQNNV